MMVLTNYYSAIFKITHKDERPTMDLAVTLKKLGFELPKLAAPAANYVPFIQSGKYVFVSGQIPFLNGQKMHIGRLGENYTVQQGAQAAQACALNILAQIDAAVDSNWSQVMRCVKLGGFVNSTPDFTEQPAVINGASDLIVAVMGESGKHTRFAVSAPSLPFGVAVEIEAMFELN
jgi:enamine deaminase RidA (YjgF/YER057c/UK114 family)